MALKLSLVIEGDASSAKKALEDTKRDVAGLSKAAKDAGTNASNTARTVETEAGKIGASTTSVITNLGAVGTRANAEIGSVGEMAKTTSTAISQVAKGAASFLVGFVAGGIIGIVGAAFDAAIGKATELVTAMVSNGPKIEAALKGQAQLIKDVEGAYRRAKGAASDYGQDSLPLLRFDAQQKIIENVAAYKAALSDLDLKQAQTRTGLFTGIDTGTFGEMIKKFRQDIVAGKADVIAFRTEVAKIAERLPVGDPRRPQAASIAKETEKAAEVQAALEQSSQILQALQGNADAAATALGSAAGKIDILAQRARAAINPLGEANRLLKSIGSASGILSGLAPTTHGPQGFAAGGIVAAPTLFGFAGGRTGLMGEAGPEAIMPLKGTARGLSVEAAGNDNRPVHLPVARMASGNLGVSLTPFAAGGIVSGITPFARGGIAAGGTSGLSGAIYGAADATDHLSGSVGNLTGLRGSVKGFFTDFVHGLEQGKSFTSGLLSSLEGLASKLTDLALNKLLDNLLSGGASRASGSSGGGFLAFLGSLFGAARGAAFLGSVRAFAAGDVVNLPTLFAYGAGRIGLMGEAGPEAIMPLTAHAGRLAVGAVANDNRETALPLTRLSSGHLGVELPRPFALGGIFGGSSSHGSGADRLVAPVEVSIINNHPNATVTEQEVPDGRGGRRIEAVIDEATAQAVGGGNRTARALATGYGVRPRVIRR